MEWWIRRFFHFVFVGKSIFVYIQSFVSALLSYRSKKIYILLPIGCQVYPFVFPVAHFVPVSALVIHNYTNIYKSTTPNINPTKLQIPLSSSINR